MISQSGAPSFETGAHQWAGYCETVFAGGLGGGAFSQPNEDIRTIIHTFGQFITQTPPLHLRFLFPLYPGESVERTVTAPITYEDVVFRIGTPIANTHPKVDPLRRIAMGCYDQ
jgi:hypothetical protein